MLSLALVLLAALLVGITSLSVWALVAAVLAGLLATAAGTIYLLYRDALVALPRNGFGLCRLGPGAVGSQSALTAWLYETLQGLAALKVLMDARPGRIGRWIRL